MDVHGLATIPSNFTARDTLDRLKAALQAQGIELFAEIDHAKNAKDAALTLKPCTVFVFGNAKAGTPLMQANQTAGIDLPLKALVWEDAESRTWISYNDPVWIARRHGLGQELIGLAGKMRDGLAAIVAQAASG